jgi:hypothetical protein
MTDQLLPELDRLDAWSFWVAPGESFGVDRVVIGTTGAFTVTVVPDEGYMKVSMGKVRIGGMALSISGLKSKAKKLKSKLASLEVETETEAIICCTHGTIGTPKNVKGVWVVRPADIVRIIAHRTSPVPRASAKKAAQSLGAKTRSVRSEGREG